LAAGTLIGLAGTFVTGCVRNAGDRCHADGQVLVKQLRIAAVARSSFSSAEPCIAVAQAPATEICCRRRFTEEIVPPRQCSSANHYPVSTHINRPANDDPASVELLK